MSNQSLTYLVAGACGLLALVAYATLILVPAWTAYTRLWERVVAAFLSLYALAAFVVLGVGGGLLVVWFWDRIA
ncbi:MAG TPA: hypothetical protein VHB30_01890 [Solirubrobacteraceae bacterium]|jgi:hypothetical protein|nr:hypothetical protein [Solirubrobacteraceae bacterium]